MQKKVSALIISFMLFYVLIHLGRHMPNLLHGRYHIGGEATWIVSLIRTVADMVVAFLFVLLSYLSLYHCYPQKKYVRLGLLLAISLMVTLTLGYVLTCFFEHTRVRMGGYFSRSLFANMVDLIFGVVFYFLQYSRYRETREQTLQLHTRQTELSFLRAQVNPHFLFNQLNNIYALVAEGAPRALTAISGLSDLLRYMLYDLDKAVPLALEADHIYKYIALQQLKYEYPVLIGIQAPLDTSGIMIHPLLLLPFVENAFKHGQLSPESELIGIVISIDADHIYFSCKNKKATGYHKDARGGIGIENVRRRLELLYPGKHRLDINDRDPDVFSVTLQITHKY